MVALLKNRWIQLGAGVVLGVVLGVVMSYVVFSGRAVGTSVGDHVSLTSGGTMYARSFEPAHLGAVGERVTEELPLTASEAVAAGWKDPIYCSPGRGRYFQKGTADESPPYFLMYDTEDQVIGIYLFSESEMPLPWRHWEELRGGGSLALLDKHWGLLVNFRDSTRACVTRGVGGSGTSWYDTGPGVRSTPTPYLPPTPTPTSAAALAAAVTRMASLKSLSFILTAEPVGTPLAAGLEATKIEGTVGLPDQMTLQVTDAAGSTESVPPDSLPFSFVDLGTTLSSIVRAVQDPAEVPNQWIDNVRHWGVSGTVTGQHLAGLIPSAVADANVVVSVWVGDDNLVRRVRIEGPLAPDDPPDVARVLDLRDFD